MTKERPVLYNAETGRLCINPLFGRAAILIYKRSMSRTLVSALLHLAPQPYRFGGFWGVFGLCLMLAGTGADQAQAQTPDPSSTPPAPVSVPSVPMMLAQASATPAAQTGTPPVLILKVESEEFPLDAQTVTPWLTLSTDIVSDPQASGDLLPATFCPAGPLAWCQLLRSETERAETSVLTHFVLDRPAVRPLLEQWNREKIRREPKDSVFEMKDGRVTAFALGDPGRTLEIDQSLDRLAETLVEIRSTAATGARTLGLPTARIKAADSQDEAERLGIRELIGEGRTNWTGSPKNRIHNFTHGAAQFNGVLIKPGEEFSFVEHLGPVDGEHGYLPELVIKHNKTTPEFGGGICQVSTTAFRAALNAGLKITMRKNHAYPVQYYRPYGMDATIYIPKPDLRFMNNTPGHILIETAVEGKELIFRFYGTKDGREVAIDGPHILERGGDGSMKTVFTQTVRSEAGETIINDSFWSSYASPSKYPHPGEEVFTEKPKGWSEKQWKEYKASRG